MLAGVPWMADVPSYNIGVTCVVELYKSDDYLSGKRYEQVGSLCWRRCPGWQMSRATNMGVACVVVSDNISMVVIIPSVMDMRK